MVILVRCYCRHFILAVIVLASSFPSVTVTKSILPIYKKTNHFSLLMSKGNQPWIFTARINAEAKALILWLPDAKSQLIGKDHYVGKDCGQEEKGAPEDEMAGWHHWLDGRASGWTLGVGDGQGGLVCCDSWGGKEWDMTEWLNWTEHN